jgi:hypothetical protein
MPLLLLFQWENFFEQLIEKIINSFLLLIPCFIYHLSQLLRNSHYDMKQIMLMKSAHTKGKLIFAYIIII